MASSRCDTVDPMRSCHRQPSAAASWLMGGAKRTCETAKSKFAERTWNVLCNQRNRKTGCRRRRPNQHSVRPGHELSHLLSTCYTETTQFRRTWISFIILNQIYLVFTTGQSGGSFQGKGAALEPAI